MSIRDLLLFGILAVLVPTILKHPFVGALAWVWFGVMNPHRLAWGAAYDFSFSMVIAIATLTGLVFTHEHRQLKGGAAGIVLVLFVVWICFTAFFAFDMQGSNTYLERVLKVFGMTGVMLMLLHTRRHVDLLIWTIVISLGYYGVKGGVFTILGGGQHMVNGPGGSVMEGNNALAVGLVVITPLMIYLYQQAGSRYVRYGLLGAATLVVFAVLGSYSRGALLSIVAMFCLLWYRSTRRWPIAIGAILFLAVAVPFMPDQWTARMQTMETYEQDESAMGRINAWETAFNLAKDRFPVGGGLEWANAETYSRYSPREVRTAFVAHSIYFQTLGGVGFIGLGLFLLFWALVWQQCNWVRRVSRHRSGLEWAFVLASMIQVGLVGYAVGGAFLDLAFWDLPYYLFVAVAVTRYVVARHPVSVAQVPSVQSKNRGHGAHAVVSPPRGKA